MSVKDVIKNSVYESLGGGTTMNAKTVILILLLACLTGIYIYTIYKLSICSCPSAWWAHCPSCASAMR